MLLTKLMKYFSNTEQKVVIVGLDNAGKTTIMYQYLTEEVVHTSPTIGSNVEEITYKKSKFVMWDLGGQESLRVSWATYYSNCDFIILVIDSTDRERLHISKDELYSMLQHEELKKAKLLLLANKQDIRGCMSATEITQSLNLTNIKDRDWHIQACCALSGEGLKLGIEWMVEHSKK